MELQRRKRWQSLRWTQSIDTMETIKGVRFGTVSNRRAAKDTAADVVYYNEDDSGLEFKNLD